MAVPQSPAANTPAFQDFDDPETFNNFKDRAESHDSLNFVVDFNESHASCAFNLDKGDLESALKDRARRREVRSVINSSLRNLTTSLRPIINILTLDGCESHWRYSLEKSNPCRNIWSPEKQKDTIEVISLGSCVAGSLTLPSFSRDIMDYLHAWVCRCAAILSRRSQRPVQRLGASA